MINFHGALDAHYEREYEDYYDLRAHRFSPAKISEEKTEELLEFMRKGEDDITR